MGAHWVSEDNTQASHSVLHFFTYNLVHYTVESQFLKPPNNSNQKLFPLGLFHCNITPDISNSHFSNQILIPLEVSKNRDPT